MRVLVVLLAFAFTPFVAGVSQAKAPNCDNGQGSVNRSAEGQAHAHKGLCAAATTTPPPSTGCTASSVNQGTAWITGRVYDANTGNNLTGWCVTVTGTVTATAVTDASGNYTLSGLPAGSYTVCETLQSGWSESFPNSSFGSSCSPSGWGWGFDLGGGQGAMFVNFGNTNP